MHIVLQELGKVAIDIANQVLELRAERDKVNEEIKQKNSELNAYLIVYEMEVVGEDIKETKQVNR